MSQMMPEATSMDVATALSHVNRLFQRLNLRRSDVDLADRYYRGKQPLTFMSDRGRKYLSRELNGFADNWCRVVADAPAERLEVIGFSLDSESSMSSEERMLWDAWRRNDLEVQSSQGFLESCIASTSYVIVWGDSDDNETVSWEHPANVIIDYDPASFRRARFALKAWQDADMGKEYATLYTPYEVWKFERGVQSKDQQIIENAFPTVSTGGWQPREVSGEPWPLANPLGEVPVVEMPNRPMLGQLPVSEVQAAKSAQDFINMQWALLYMASEYASLPQRVVLGAEPPKIPIFDQSGKKVGEKPVDPEQLASMQQLWLTGASAKIDQWQAASPTWFLETLDRVVKNLAAQTRTPPHYLSGDLINISAEALRASEAGLGAKVREAQTSLTPAIRDVFRLIAKVRGEDGLAEQVRLGRVVWRNAEARSEAQMVDAAQKLVALGMPFPAVMEYLGKSPAEIESLEAMRLEDSRLDARAFSTLADLPEGE